MSGAFEAGIPAGRRNTSVIGTGSGFSEDAPYSTRDLASTREQTKPNGAMLALTAALRLVVPVILLLTTFAASYLYNDVKLSTLHIPADGLTLGYLLLPTTFFAIQLTNRRYGPGYAFAQAVAGWVLAGAILAAAWNYLRLGTLPNPFPDLRSFSSFAAALFLAQTISIIVFDGARGPRWWTAPFLSSIWGAAVFCLIAYPAAYAGTSYPWLREMLINLGLMSAMSVVLVIPYWLLRPLVRPLPGFGGY